MLLGQPRASCEQNGLPACTCFRCSKLPCPALPPALAPSSRPTQQAAGESLSGSRAWSEGAPAQAMAGLSAVFAALIQPRFQLKADFLRGLLKRLRAGSDLVGAGAAEADLHLLAFCTALVAGLPYRRGDEPCMVVQVGPRGEA